MQLIDTKCPMCMGNVVRIPGTNTGECESCGSRFTLPEEAANMATADGAGEAAGVRDGRSIEEIVDDFASTLSAKDEYEFLVGTDLDTGKGKKKQQAARKYFDIGSSPEIYLVLDTTIMGSGKVGFALCEDGFYCKDEDGDVGYLNWEDFADVRIETDDGTIEIGGYPFHTQEEEADLLFDLLCDIQKA